MQCRQAASGIKMRLFLEALFFRGFSIDSRAEIRYNKFKTGI